MRVSEIITETTKISHDDVRFSQTIRPDSEASHIIALKIGLLCNNVIIENLTEELKNWVVVGDPTEKALLLAGRSAGLKKEDLEKEEPRIAEIPFDSEYKFMATLHKTRNGGVVYIKGAPEKILALSSFVDVEGKKVTLTSAKEKEIQKQYERLTSLGLRVLAVAYKRSLQNHNPEEPASHPSFTSGAGFTRENLGDLVFVGLVALRDPLRPEVKRAIGLCQSAGIRPLIVTGDHKLTAMAIARELGISVSQENVLEGLDLDGLNDEQLQKLVKKIVIFARVEPKHKIRIVKALQTNGEVVAMTGDGVNDAPALKKADIGVVMGSGTDVAKEIADLILLDNNFKTIVEAVRRGRITFNNIRKVILYLLTDAFTSMILVGGSVILGLPLPLLPAQILWIKLAESSLPAMALAFDEIDEGVMKKRPRKKDEPVLNVSMKRLILFYALIMDLVLFGLFYYFWKTSGNLDLARTIAFTGLGMNTFLYIFAVRGYYLPVYKINPFGNKFLVLVLFAGLAIILFAVYTPFLNKNILYTVPLRPKEWFVLGSYAMLSIVVYEVGKKFTIAKTTTKFSYLRK
jgi:Ca2+-transporting ATPase